MTLAQKAISLLKRDSVIIRRMMISLEAHPGVGKSLGIWASIAITITAAVAAGNVLGSDIDIPKLAKLAKPSVVFLEARDAAGRTTASGSGFFVSSDGAIATNHHVLAESLAAKVFVKMSDGSQAEAVGVLGIDADNDLALIKAPIRATPLGLGDDTAAEIGDKVVVIGSPWDSLIP